MTFSNERGNVIDAQIEYYNYELTEVIKSAWLFYNKCISLSTYYDCSLLIAPSSIKIRDKKLLQELLEYNPYKKKMKTVDDFKKEIENLTEMEFNDLLQAAREVSVNKGFSFLSTEEVESIKKANLDIKKSIRGLPKS